MRLLLVEDHAPMALVIERTLVQLAERAGGSARCVHVSTLAEASDRLAEAEPFSAVLLDLKLADSSPETTLDWLRARAHELPPVLVFSGLPADRPWRREALRAGADDFLSKFELQDSWQTFFTRIVNAVWKRERTAHVAA